ncbi:MAG TPA: biotin/lipoyl-binding protein [Paludibacteraceae bacterium]|nr:biotin/lipoyl-binding protein [Paludibacteraceae bacterium]
MKKYLITVNQKQYEVEVVEVKQQVQTQKTTSGIKPSVTVSKPKETVAGANGHKVAAPMPSNIIKLLVNEGDIVNEGDNLLVFEAMKMENNLHSPVSGKIASIKVKVGNSVAAGDTLIIIE